MPAANQANESYQEAKALADKGVYVSPNGETIKRGAPMRALNTRPMARPPNSQN